MENSEPEIAPLIPAIQKQRPEEALFESVSKNKQQDEDVKDERVLLDGRRRLPHNENPSARLIPERPKSGNILADRSRSRSRNQPKPSLIPSRPTTTTTTTTTTLKTSTTALEEFPEEVAFETEAPLALLPVLPTSTPPQELPIFVPDSSLPLQTPIQTQVLVSRPKVAPRPAPNQNAQPVHRQPQVRYNLLNRCIYFTNHLNLFIQFERPRPPVSSQTSTTSSPEYEYYYEYEDGTPAVAPPVKSIDDYDLVPLTSKVKPKTHYQPKNLN